MYKMFTSASRMVLIIITVVVCIGFIMRILEAKDFIILASMVFTYYFTKSNSGDHQDYTE